MNNSNLSEREQIAWLRSFAHKQTGPHKATLLQIASDYEETFQYFEDTCDSLMALQDAALEQSLIEYRTVTPPAPPRACAARRLRP